MRAGSDSGLVLQRPLTFTLLFLVVLAAAALAGEPATAIQVRVDSVLATNTNQGIDARLQPIVRQLHQFSYTTYQLVSHEEGRAALGKMVDFTLPGGRLLHVEPSATEGSMVDMEVMLFSGERPMLKTHVKFPNGAVLLLALSRYEQGALIVSMSAAALRKNQPSGLIKTPAP